jgi:hypothetical protein
MVIPYKSGAGVRGLTCDCITGGIHLKFLEDRVWGGVDRVDSTINPE